MKRNAQLEEALRRSVPDSEIPPALHTSIIRAVQRAGPPVATVRRRSTARWVPAAAALALACALWAWHAGSRTALPPSGLERASAALATSQKMAQAAPVAALAPLTEEWQRLNRDLDNTAQFLLAALP
jgi:hypothetical protein